MLARFYHQEPISIGATVVLDHDNSHHAAQVLRLKSGDQITLFNGSGGEFSGNLTQTGKSQCQVQICYFHDIERESPLSVQLAQAVCASEKMDWIIQKAVEQGVAHIQPLLTQRSIVRLSGERAEKRQRHWQRIIISACEQCGRNKIPRLLPLLTLTGWLEQKRKELASPHKRNLVLSPNASLRLAQLPVPGRDEDTTLLIGPEGGFTTEENEAVRLAGFLAIQLGKRILRTETAALAAIAAIQSRWGDY
ncbi:MAG: 16S rRNA (uracil(1498)-N(3))-methyltransferase [Nitrosomonas sp.]|nr:16S rRNA (uracil(1498)-N(3))-methyltransferase [Nitrosomonas sp.]